MGLAAMASTGCARRSRFAAAGSRRLPPGSRRTPLRPKGSVPLSNVYDLTAATYDRLKNGATMIQYVRGPSPRWQAPCTSPGWSPSAT